MYTSSRIVSLTGIPTSSPEPFTPAYSPQASTRFQVPVDPPGPNRAFKLTVKPDSPSAQVNTFSPTNSPPHGVYETWLSPLTTVVGPTAIA